jgi:hypothetical protein
MQTCTQMTQNESVDQVENDLSLVECALTMEDKLGKKDGSPLRNALREYLKSYNGITESRERVTV